MGSISASPHTFEVKGQSAFSPIKALRRSLSRSPIKPRSSIKPVKSRLTLFLTKDKLGVDLENRETDNKVQRRNASPNGDADSRPEPNNIFNHISGIDDELVPDRAADHGSRNDNRRDSDSGTGLGPKSENKLDSTNDTDFEFTNTINLNSTNDIHLNYAASDIDPDSTNNIKLNFDFDFASSASAPESRIESMYFADPALRLNLSSNPGDQSLHRSERGWCTMSNYAAEIDRRLVGSSAMRDFAYAPSEPLHEQAYGHADGES